MIHVGTSEMTALEMKLVNNAIYINRINQISKYMEKNPMFMDRKWRGEWEQG